MIAAPRLVVEGLAKRFRLHARGLELEALRPVSFTLLPGTLTALTGPSGSGKSTILRCCWRSCRPDAGRILLRHRGGIDDLAAAGERRVLALRGPAMALVTQFLHCLPRQPARRVVALPLLAAGVGEAEAAQRAEEALDQAGLAPRLRAVPPATFSGGERARVNLARALAQRPDLLLLDEPTASLDPASTAAVAATVRRMVDAGTTVLAVLHDPAQVARIADAEIRLVPSGVEP